MVICLCTKNLKGVQRHRIIQKGHREKHWLGEYSHLVWNQDAMVSRGMNIRGWYYDECKTCHRIMAATLFWPQFVAMVNIEIEREQKMLVKDILMATQLGTKLHHKKAHERWSSKKIENPIGIPTAVSDIRPPKAYRTKIHSGAWSGTWCAQTISPHGITTSRQRPHCLEQGGQCPKIRPARRNKLRKKEKNWTGGEAMEPGTCRHLTRGKTPIAKTSYSHSYLRVAGSMLRKLRPCNGS